LFAGAVLRLFWILCSTAPAAGAAGAVLVTPVSNTVLVLAKNTDIVANQCGPADVTCGPANLAKG